MTEVDAIARTTDEASAGEARIVAVRRDCWNESGNHRPYQNVVWREGKEWGQLSKLEDLFNAAGVQDGDEIEVIVRRTGNRPYGDRRIRFQSPHTYGEETDEQFAARTAAASPGAA